ncbi:MAG: DUF2938 family protein [Pseudolabrys sp.]
MWQSVVIGLFATAVTDGWQLLLKSLAGLPPANWRLIGRWVCHFSDGKITHAPIVPDYARAQTCTIRLRLYGS